MAHQPAIGTAMARVLAAMTELGRGLGLTVRPNPADSHQLSLRFEDQSGETLVLVVEPVRQQRTYYQKSDRIGFWYVRADGAAATDPTWTKRLLESVADLVFSPAHDAVASELAARGQQASRPQQESAGGEPEVPVAAGAVAAARDQARESASYTREGGYVGWIPPSPRHVLMNLLKPFYDRYILAILARYIPVEARAADSVLDAMCGRNLPNLTALRRYFAGARIVAATDVDIEERRKAPRGTSVFRADLFAPLPGAQRYQLITVFKPPTGGLGKRIETVFAHLAAALEPGGHLFLVLGESNHTESTTAALNRLGLVIVASEANAVSSILEIEHVWILVARAPR